MMCQSSGAGCVVIPVPVEDGWNLVPRSTFRRSDCRRPRSSGDACRTAATRKLLCATEGSARMEIDTREEQSRKHGVRNRDH